MSIQNSRIKAFESHKEAQTTGNPNQDEKNPLVYNPTTTTDGPTSKKILGVISIPIAALILGQYFYGVANHSPLLSIQFATSMLLLISSLELINPKETYSGQSVHLLYRTAGIVFFVACLFLNLTHCLEDISDLSADADHGGHGHEEQFPSNHHGLNDIIMYITALDFIAKLIYNVIFNALKINPVLNNIATLGPTTVTAALFGFKYYGGHFPFEWLDHHIEPVTSIILTIVCISIALYSLYKKKQYLLAEGPRNFCVDKISRAVKAVNGSLEKIDHVHASCEWPTGFSVSLKAYIRVEKTNKDWVSNAAHNFADLKTLLHTEIKAQGANEVIVEPVFIDRNEPSDFVDTICIDPSCHNENLGCCTRPKPAKVV